MFVGVHDFCMCMHMCVYSCTCVWSVCVYVSVCVCVCMDACVHIFVSVSDKIEIKIHKVALLQHCKWRPFY